MCIREIGCGNGKYLSVNEMAFKVGSDICIEMADIARANGREVTVSDNLKLPYRDGLFDAVISVGVIHHLTSARRRVQALQELSRVTRRGGKILVCVWAMEQKNRKVEVL